MRSTRRTFYKASVGPYKRSIAGVVGGCVCLYPGSWCAAHPSNWTDSGIKGSDCL